MRPDAALFLTNRRSASLPIVTRYPPTPPQVAFAELVWTEDQLAEDATYRYQVPVAELYL